MNPSESLTSSDGYAESEIVNVDDSELDEIGGGDGGGPTYPPYL